MIAVGEMTIEWLHASLDRRERPEDVAVEVGRLLGIDARSCPHFEAVTAHAGRWSSMSDDFARPRGFPSQIDLASSLSGVSPPGGNDPVGIGVFIREFERLIGMESGRVDFKWDRLNRESRRSAGIDLSRRQYNKRFRLASRMERKLSGLSRGAEKRRLQQVSKSRLACDLSLADVRDPNTAAFVAYYTAKCNLRSVFTNRKQDRPFDGFCRFLLDRCLESTSTNWLAIAYVYPDAEVLSFLSDGQKGMLIGKWYNILVRLAVILKDVWDRSNINRRSMIVRRGDDSSTWNIFAGAWNKARDSWISLLCEMGMGEILDEFCPGKVLRLMAADVVGWHSLSSGERSPLEEDTGVWADLPLPWDVFVNHVSCTRSMVEAACARRGVDPVRKGWVSAKRMGVVHPFRPTPELVHGVQIANPYLAGWMKKRGFFSGKSTRDDLAQR